MAGNRDVRLIVGAVGISAAGDFLLWVPLTLHLQAKAKVLKRIVGSGANRVVCKAATYNGA